MVVAVHLATTEMGEVGLRQVADFHKEHKMIRMGQLCKDGSTPMKMNATDTGCPPDPDYENDWMAMAMSMLNAPFLPNLLNTVVWLADVSDVRSDICEL